MDPRPMSRGEALRVLLGTPMGLALLSLLEACSAGGPRPIRVGEEECAHCRMRISQEAFAAQAMNDRGRSWTFDSIECLTEWLLQENEVPEARIQGAWVTDFHAPGEWLRAHEAIYLRSEGLRSPMGLGLSAYSGSGAAHGQADAHGGDVLSWTDVRTLVSDTPLRGGGAGHGH
ncbi:MAG: nitrous oxide reductase accessory protein NosL [Gemmatimonadota bacterium]